MSNTTIELNRHHFNVQQYHQMYEAGIFTESDRLLMVCEGAIALLN